MPPPIATPAIELADIKSKAPAANDEIIWKAKKEAKTETYQYNLLALLCSSSRDDLNPRVKTPLPWEQRTLEIESRVYLVIDSF